MTSINSTGSSVRVNTTHSTSTASAPTETSAQPTGHGSRSVFDGVKSEAKTIASRGKSLAAGVQELVGGDLAEDAGEAREESAVGTAATVANLFSDANTLARSAVKIAKGDEMAEKYSAKTRHAEGAAAIVSDVAGIVDGDASIIDRAKSGVALAQDVKETLGSKLDGGKLKKVGDTLAKAATAGKILNIAGGAYGFVTNTSAAVQSAVKGDYVAAAKQGVSALSNGISAAKDGVALLETAGKTAGVLGKGLSLVAKSPIAKAIPFAGGVIATADALNNMRTEGVTVHSVAKLATGVLSIAAPGLGTMAGLAVDAIGPKALNDAGAKVWSFVTGK